MAYLFSSVIPFLMSADNRNFSYFGNCRKAILANTSSSSILVNIFSSVLGIPQLQHCPTLSRRATEFIFQISDIILCETPADVAVRIRRVVAQVQGESASVRAVVPIRAPIGYPVRCKAPAIVSVCSI